MRLRHLFEAKTSEVAIIFGRFNPPHKGHRAAWELASQSPIWYVGTNQSTVGPKDPLPYDVKVEAMKTIWPEVEGHIVAETSWLTLASEVYKKYPDATLLCLTDEDWVTKTIVQYNGKEGAHGFYNFKKITQKPTPRLSSATALRDAVAKGDRDAFSQAAGVPADTPVAGKPFFDLVAEYLLPYQNAPKKVTKKKEPAPVETIEKHGSQYRLVSKHGHKNLGTYPTKAGAEKRERQVQYFKHANEDVSEGFFGLSSKEKGAIMNLVSKLSDIPNMWDHEAQTFTNLGKSELEKSLNYNPDYVKYALSLSSKDYEAEDAAGVGIITKQNTTKDVNKGTLRKMMKGFKLI